MRRRRDFRIALNGSRAAVVLGLGLIVLAACGPSEPARDPTGDVVTYRCADDSEFKVSFFAGSPSIQVEIGGQTSDLAQEDSDLGIVYSDGVMVLSILRDYANLFGSPKGDLVECEDVDQSLFG